MSYLRLNDEASVELPNVYPVSPAQVRPVLAQPVQPVHAIAVAQPQQQYEVYAPTATVLPRQQSDSEVALHLHQQLNGPYQPQQPQQQPSAAPAPVPVPVPVQYHFQQQPSAAPAPVPVPVPVQYHYPAQDAQVEVAVVAPPLSSAELRPRISRTAKIKLSPGIVSDAWSFYKLNCCALTGGLCMWIMIVLLIVAACVGGGFAIVADDLDSLLRETMIMPTSNGTRCAGDPVFESPVPMNLEDCQEACIDCNFIVLIPPTGGENRSANWWMDLDTLGICQGFEHCDATTPLANAITFEKIFDKNIFDNDDYNDNVDHHHHDLDQSIFAICPNSVLLPDASVHLPDFDEDDFDADDAQDFATSTKATCHDAAVMCSTFDTDCTGGEMNRHDVQAYFSQTACCPFHHEVDYGSQLKDWVDNLSSNQKRGLITIAIIGGLLILLIATAAPASYLVAIFEALRSNSKIQCKHFFACFACPYLCRLLGLLVVSQICVQLGYWAWFFPGLVLSVLFMFILPLHREHRFLSVWGTLKASSLMVYHNLANTLAFLLASAVAIAIGFFTVFGWVVLLPLTAVVYSMLYHEIAGINGVPTRRLVGPLFALQAPGVPAVV